MLEPNAPSLRRVAATCESAGAEIISSAGALRAKLDMRAPDQHVAYSLEAIRHELTRALSYLDEYERNTKPSAPTLETAWDAVNGLGGWSNPDDLEARGYGRALDDAMDAIERLGADRSRVEPFKQVGAAAAVALSDHLAAAPTVRRLVPRMPAATSASAMGVVSPRGGGGGEAA